MLGYLKMRFLLHCNWLRKNYNITCKEKKFKVIQILCVLSLHLALQLTRADNFIGFFRHHSLQVMLGPIYKNDLKRAKKVWPHYYLKVWKSEPPHLLEDLNLPLTTAIKNKGFTQCLLIIFLFWTFTICFIDLFHFHSLPKNWYHITSLPLPIIATFQQRPLTSVSRVAIIERFDCVGGSVTGSPNLHKEEGCTRFLFLQALSESNWPLMRHCFTQKSCFTSCA